MCILRCGSSIDWDYDKNKIQHRKALGIAKFGKSKCGAAVSTAWTEKECPSRKMNWMSMYHSKGWMASESRPFLFYISNPDFSPFYFSDFDRRKTEAIYYIWRVSDFEVCDIPTKLLLSVVLFVKSVHDS